MTRLVYVTLYKAENDQTLLFYIKAKMTSLCFTIKGQERPGRNATFCWDPWSLSVKNDGND